MDVGNIEKNMVLLVKLLKAVANEKRLVILCALYKKECSVGALEDVTRLSQSALSQHLAKLRKDGIVKTRRDAQTIYYSIKDPAAEMLMHTLCDIAKNAG